MVKRSEKLFLLYGIQMYSFAPRSVYSSASNQLAALHSRPCGARLHRLHLPFLLSDPQTVGSASWVYLFTTRCQLPAESIQWMK